MLQRQMVGIKTRAERLAREWSAPTDPAVSVVAAPPVALTEVEEPASPATNVPDPAEGPELATASVA
jgi:hypothetical protein